MSRVSPEEKDLACDACEAAIQVVSVVMVMVKSKVPNFMSLFYIQVIDLMLLGVDESGIENALSSENSFVFFLHICLIFVDALCSWLFCIFEN